MISDEIRRRFLHYFQEKGHAIIPSSSVVPHDDPTLLFTNAGMNQFKDVFLGKSQRDYTRAATAQKCIRAGGKHNDLDNVGHTSRHMTFFEMLGNFSFGDYFKEQAIDYAWHMSTQVLEIDPKHLWITVFREDDEAFSLWQKHMPVGRIVRMDEKDNFWAMGDTGPCGPCSELYVDRGPKYGSASSLKEDTAGERYLEFWNLVFMQFNRDASGKLTPLPNQSIDTGAGLERIAAIKMGVDTIFATDILRSLIAQVEKVSGKPYENNPAFHVIADHIRSLSFAIADGAQPSNVERGYVLRKILRRAVRYGRTLGFQEPFLAKILPRLIETMGTQYPALIAAQARIGEILTLEEEGFLRTLKRGGNILSNVIEKAKASPLKEIRGEEAFTLKDTYGFPLEEILLLAKDSGLQVNLETFQILEEQAKEKSRSAQAVHTQEVEENLFKGYAETHGPCAFVGYSDTQSESTILGIVAGGSFVQMLNAGEEGMILLDKTPFYAEKGGQIGDTGTLVHHQAHFTVTACRAPYPDAVVHIGTLDKGVLLVGEPVTARVDSKRRSLIEAHHTATHLLHWALQQVLGPHIKQAGSLVEPGRLRFDFNHHKPLSPQEIRAVEDLVNEKIRENSSVSAYELSFADVQKRSDIKQFFGDKYGSRVRVIDIDFSKELCGGTHVKQLGAIGLFRIAKESSIAAGVRRIEAVTGKAAEELMHAQEDLAQEAASLLKAPLAKLSEKIAELLEENKESAHKLKKWRRQELQQLAEGLAKKVVSAGSTPLLATEVGVDGDELSPLADDLMQRIPSCVLILAAKQAERCQLLVRVSADLVQKGIQAAALIKKIAPLVGGSGGGKENSAQAGGKRPEGIPQALEQARTFLSNL